MLKITGGYRKKNRTMREQVCMYVVYLETYYSIIFKYAYLNRGRIRCCILLSIKVR